MRCCCSTTTSAGTSRCSRHCTSRHADLLGLPKELFQVEIDLGLRWDASRRGRPEPGDSWLGSVGRELLRRVGRFRHRRHPHRPRPVRRDTTWSTCRAVDFMDPADQEPLLGTSKRAARWSSVRECRRSIRTSSRAECWQTRSMRRAGRAIGSGELIWAESTDIPAMLDELAPPAAFRADDPAVQLSVHPAR